MNRRLEMGAALNPKAGRLLAPAICLALLTFTQRTIHALRTDNPEQRRWSKRFSEPGNTIGNLIVAERTKMGMTQEQLAKKAGVHRQWLGRWERDRLLPLPSDLEKLRHILKFLPAA
jgi:ribosome-binding protein aMBF1 (putative translation factor)